MTDYFTFPCGCKFETLQEDPLRIKFDGDISKIPLDCSLTWDIFARGDTKGVFQLESRLGSSLSKKLKPENIEHLSALVAILRPGALEAVQDGKTVTSRYIDRKNGEEQVAYLHSALEPALKDTYGLMIYQENAMRVAKDIAGFDLQQADVLRKAIGKKKTDIMAKVKIEFIDGCKRLGLVPDDIANQVFELIEKSQRYSFNKSHSVSYALNAYLSAYTKAHFPKAFFTSYLYHAKEKQKPLDEIKELVSNARLNRIKIKTPDFRKRNPHFKSYDDTVYFGFTDIKGVGESSISTIDHNVNLVSKQIQKECEDWGWLDFLLFMSPNLNSTAAKALIASGSLDYLNMSRTQMLFEYDIFNNLNKKEILWLQNQYFSYPDLTFGKLLCQLGDAPPGRKEGSGCSNKTRQAKIRGWCGELESPPYKLVDSSAWIEGVERELMGIAITCDSIDNAKIIEANFTCRDFIDKKRHTGPVIIAGTLNEVHAIKTKKGKSPGQNMAFSNIDDMTGSISLVIFPDAYKEYKKFLYEENQVMVMGAESKNKDSLIVEKIVEI